MDRTKSILFALVTVSLLILMAEAVSAGWSKELTLPSDKTPAPEATPSVTQPASSEQKRALTFPTTTEEIANGLPKPSVGATKGTRGVGGIAVDQIVTDEKLLAQMPKVAALILFDYNSDRIKDESKPLLNEYGKALQGPLKDAVLLVAGHTDGIGSDQFNLDLSNRRAEAVKKFLIAEFQLAEQRLIVKPYGKKKPIESNETEEGRAKNRRVEFVRLQ